MHIDALRSRYAWPLIAVTILSFAESNTATTVEFDDTPKDPVPPDLVLELGQKLQIGGIGDRVV